MKINALQTKSSVLFKKEVLKLVETYENTSSSMVVKVEALMEIKMKLLYHVVTPSQCMTYYMLSIWI